MFICPLCGQQHPDGTSFCDVMWSPITVVGTDSKEAVPDVPGRDESDCRCPVCGTVGNPGDECWQCGSRITAPTEPCPVYAVLTPNLSVEVPRGKTFTLGREGGVGALDEFLSRFDTVSRRHCSIFIDESLGAMSLTDLGSTNGTYADDRRLDPGKTERVSLPAVVGLGTKVTVEFREAE